MASLNAVVANLFFLCTISIASSLEAGKGPFTYIFGDSMSDVGNNNYLPLCLAKSDYPWYGIDYKYGLPTGRFTNGRTIGDIMAEKLGISSPPPYLSLSMDDNTILEGGVNYASGGAGILNETGLYFIQKLSFDNQITAFETTRNAIAQKIGEEAAEKLCNDAFYLVALGSNDYINNFLQPFMADGTIYTHNEFMVLLMTTLDRQLRRLYDLGARMISFDGLAPLGCIPSQRVRSGTGQCLEHVNQFALEFNSQAKKLLNGLNFKLPGAKMVLSDTYTVVMDLIENPQKYGFTTSHTSCCNVDTTVGGLCLPNSQLCPNRREFVFWDAYHTSDAANQIIADRLFAEAGVSQAPPPAPLVGSGPVPSPAAPSLNSEPAPSPSS
ncbi:GDSL esterase/lipase [Ananas comosus]|uniref:GDSL esterase/lipase n=1 Tax=Ananas comosus TaxID=4615 RepID=A0A199VQ57_ANACO|nr:GDSL esterase/lipase [Ananas comosus]